jgi:hypothetical protein
MSWLELANHSTKDNAISTPGALQIEATESRMSMIEEFCSAPVWSVASWLPHRVESAGVAKRFRWDSLPE